MFELFFSRLYWASILMIRSRILFDASLFVNQNEMRKERNMKE